MKNYTEAIKRNSSASEIEEKWECKRYPHTSRCGNKRDNGKCPGKSRGKYCSRRSTIIEPHEKTSPGFAGRIEESMKIRTAESILPY